MSGAGTEAVVEASGQHTGAVPSRGRRAAWVLLRVALTALLLALLLRKIEFSELGAAVGRAIGNWPMLAVAYGLPLIGILIVAMRWRVLMEVQGQSVAVHKVGAAVLVGTCFNQVLPSTIGGDFARSMWLTRPGESALASFAVVTLDRAIGVLALCLLALVCIVLNPALVRALPTGWLFPAVVAVAALLMAALAIRYARPIGDWIFSKGPFRRFRSKAQLVHETLRAYRGRTGALVWAALLSICLQLAIVVQYLALAKAIGVDVPAWELALIVPVVTLVTLVPITINGLGLREGAFALLGAPFGLGAGDAITLGWLWFAGTVGYGLVGGVIYLCGRRP